MRRGLPGRRPLMASPDAAAPYSARARVRARRLRARFGILTGLLRTLTALIVLAAGAALGLWTAWLAVEREIGFEAIRIGSWTAWPTAGEAGADPYVRARFARTGELPLNIAEGIAFAAREDDEGRRLDGACEYRLAGRLPAAQWWTISVYRDADLSLMANPARRYVFNSTEVLRTAGGGVEIVVGPRARPGNWLPTDPGAGPVRLMLRLYDTPLSTGGRIGNVGAPAVTRVACP